MKFVTFKTNDGQIRSGWMKQEFVIDMNHISKGVLPKTMIEFLKFSDENLKIAQQIDRKLNFHKKTDGMYFINDVELQSPIPNPASIRDFYAFEEHVKNARKRRQLDVVPEWYEIPVFYFTNHHAVVGTGVSIKRPLQCQKLDYELEIACVLGNKGENISIEEADHYIFGYMIMNDWSARDIQMKEMKVGLGPAKGKDFATSLGPYIVTKDELEPFRKNGKYHLEMMAKINDQIISKGNFSSIYYSFAEMIARASENVTLYPGDVIGSGTVGSGCILELGEEVHRYLQSGDIIELSVTGLGVLKNTVE